MQSPSIQITELLNAWGQGDKSALDRLLPMVESELRRIAHNFMRGERENHTLQTTALVNEAYMRLAGQRTSHWTNRSQFYALSAQIMRRILLNHARDRLAKKRGGREVHVDVDEAIIMSPEKSAELIALDDALVELAGFDPLKSQIVELRYFGGLTLDETAKVLGIASITVSVHWRLAKAWLAREISDRTPTKL